MSALNFNMAALQLTGNTKVQNGSTYHEYVDLDMSGGQSLQWIKDDTLKMTMSDAERIIAEADIEALEAELNEELESDYVNDEDNQAHIASLRARIQSLKSSIA
jgi:hypothetical protein